MSTNEIVVGLDDSPTARAALQWAAGQATLTGASLRAVHVLDWPVGLSQSATVEPGTQLLLRSENVDVAWRRGMTGVFTEIRSRPGWTLQFAQGAVGDVLVQVAEHARLLVVGTREPVASDHRAGSVVHYCISHATCPVAAIPSLATPASGSPLPPVRPGSAVRSS